MFIGSFKICRTIFLASILRLSTPCPPSCPPGTHCSVEKDCCVKCETGTFQDKETNTSSCRDCRPACGQKQIVIQECNALADLICQCIDGFYLVHLPEPYGTCERHKMCDPGYGVEILGNHFNDTVCKPCGEYQFSENQSSTEPCLDCTTCLIGEEVLHQCTSTSDRQCKPTDCGQVEAPDHGSFYKHNDTTYQSEVMFTCDTGYRLLGSPTIYCRSSGKWTGTPPSCVALDSHLDDGAIAGIVIGVFIIGIVFGAVGAWGMYFRRRCAKGNVNDKAGLSTVDQNSDETNKTQEDEKPGTSQTKIDNENKQKDSEQDESTNDFHSLQEKREQTNRHMRPKKLVGGENIGNRNNTQLISQPVTETTDV